jgi:hypothetical protein
MEEILQWIELLYTKYKLISSHQLENRKRNALNHRSTNLMGRYYR